MSPIWPQCSPSLTAGTVTLVVLCMPVPAAGMGWIQQGNKRGQGHTLETAVLGLGSTLPSSATPFSPLRGLCPGPQWAGGLCTGPRGKAGPSSGMRKGLSFFLGKAACCPYPALGKLLWLSTMMPFPWHLCSQGPISLLPGTKCTPPHLTPPLSLFCQGSDLASSWGWGRWSYR